MNEETVDIREIFQEAFVLYKGSLPLLVSLGLIYAIASEFGQVVFQNLPFQSPGLLFLMSMLISAFISVALIYAGAEIYQGKEIDLRQAFASVKEKYWNYVMVSIGFFVVVISGILFFVVPGAYFGTIFIFSNLLVILENKTFIEAFQRSADLVRGHFWRVFLFSLITACFLVIPGIILDTLKFSGLNLGRIIQMCLMVFIIPYITMVQVGLYYRMKELYEKR